VSRADGGGHEISKGTADQGIATVYFANETGLPVVLCVAGLRGTASFEIDPYGRIAVQFVDDGFERVISAFTPSQTTAVCYFPMVPGNFCVIIQQGALGGTHKKDFNRQTKPATNKRV